ncbi:hypothetical protein [Bacillus manliponensis]
MDGGGARAVRSNRSVPYWFPLFTQNKR